ncbi:MAG TPA: hypothetical protein PLE22_01390 [Acidovorax sp.]|jgi:hypothetical protein|nr:hypothetical protein [Acidovorax sp.]
MDLHHHTGHLITQLETMLMQTRNLLEALGLEDSFPSEIEARASREGLLQHLRNTIDMLGGSALGYSWAIDAMLPIIGELADAGAIPQAVAEKLLQPAYEHLGERYVDSAMAAGAEG